MVPHVRAQASEASRRVERLASLRHWHLLGMMRAFRVWALVLELGDAYAAAIGCASQVRLNPTMALAMSLSLYTILFHFKVLLWESIIRLLPPPICKAYPIVILLHDHCAIYAPPQPPPLVCHTSYSIGDGNIV